MTNQGGKQETFPCKERGKTPSQADRLKWKNRKTGKKKAVQGKDPDNGKVDR